MEQLCERRNLFNPRSPFNNSTPIPVPRNNTRSPLDTSDLDESYRGSDAFKPLSPIGFATRDRRPSISFHPSVKAEDGQGFALQDPLPRRERRRRTGSFGARSLEALNSGLSFEKVSLDGGAGRHVGGASNVGVENDCLNSGAPSESTPVPVLMKNASSNGQRDEASLEPLSSLTSSSTISTDEARTPPRVGSATALLSAFYGGTPAEDCGIIRNKSFDRSQRRRRPRRTLTDRSTHSIESGMSCASALLNSWGSGLSMPTTQNDTEEVGDYVIGRELGHGGFSVVKEAVTIKDGIESRVAVKIVQKQHADAESENDAAQASFEHEIDVWRCLSHRNILPLLEVYHTPRATYCFMEHIPAGTLFDLVSRNRQGLSQALVQRFTHHLASAIRYMHQDARIVHRDIKLENCLLQGPPEDPSQQTVLVTDFGMSQYIAGTVDDDNPSQPYDRPRAVRADSLAASTTFFTGSIQYAAPELCATSNPLVTPAVDIWALGVSLFTMSTGHLPFCHDFYPSLQDMIIKGQWDEGDFLRSEGVRADEEMGRQALEVLRGCLQTDVEKRWTIDMVLKSPWLKHLGNDDSD